MQKSFKDCTEVTGAGKRWLLKARTVDIVYFEIGYFDKLGNSALYYLRHYISYLYHLLLIA